MHGTASRNVARFIRHLRHEGYLVGVQDTMAGLRAMQLRAQADQHWFYHSLRALSCKSNQDWQRFEQLYLRFWFPQQAEPEPPSAAERIDPRLRGSQAGLTGMAHSVFDQDLDSQDTQLYGSGAGRQNTLSKADFRFLTDRRDLREIERLAELLGLRLRKRLSRRYRSAGRGERVDIPRTLHESIRQAGEPCRLRYRQRIRKLPRLLIIQDVSHSMAGYTPLLTRYTRGLLRVFPDAEAFVFHTRLYHVTQLYREGDPERLRRRLEGKGKIWLGGTRIAESLASLNREHAHAVLDRRTLILILSDACDSDDPRLLREQLLRLKQGGRSLIWLNPLLGRGTGDPLEDFHPDILEVLDHVHAAHTLDSLRDAGDILARL